MMPSDVCLSVAYIRPKSRTERPMKTKIGTDLPTSHVTRTPLSRSKGQGHQAALLTVALTREAGAAVTVRTYRAWETTATLRLLGGIQGAGAPMGEERGGAYRGGRPPIACYLEISTCGRPALASTLWPCLTSLIQCICSHKLHFSEL